EVEGERFRLPAKQPRQSVAIEREIAVTYIVHQTVNRHAASNLVGLIDRTDGLTNQIKEFGSALVRNDRWSETDGRCFAKIGRELSPGRLYFRAVVQWRNKRYTQLSINCSDQRIERLVLIRAAHWR